MYWRNLLILVARCSFLINIFIRNDFLIREPFTQLPTSHTEFSSFESSSVTLKLPHSKISVFNIYRPPSSSTFSKPFSVFLNEFNSFLFLPLPHLMNSSSPTTLTSTFVITQTTLPLSFSLSFVIV